MAQTHRIWTAPLVRLPIFEDRNATLMETWHVEVRGWTFDVPEGTKTDGASIPRALWGVCGHPLEAPRVYAAIVHDWLYGGGGPVGMTRAEADAVYRDLLVAYGWGRWRAWIEWTALRVCGASHWTSRTEKEK